MPTQLKRTICQLMVSHAAAASTTKPIVLDSNSKTDDEDIDKPSEKKLRQKIRQRKRRPQKQKR